MEKGLKEKLANLPHAPGVYLMKNAKGDILYVGKARDLRKRVRSYFRGANSKDLKTSLLIGKTAGFDTILTNTEQEALINCLPSSIFAIVFGNVLTKSRTSLANWKVRSSRSYTGFEF